jgi:glycosyltransferase involved in cell wall biosynthesis
MVPRVAHFVFGLSEQDEPLHPVHYMAVESCRRVLEPDAIYFHHKHLPWGPYWERIRPFLTLVEVDLADEVLAADYSGGRVPAGFRYAHHADFIRLDALIEHGGVYADMDTIFLRPFPKDLFDAPFVIGREAPVTDERTGELRPSLCNALLMAEKGSLFARQWRERMAGELNGTWSNHSGFLAQALSEELPAQVRLEPPVTFFSFPANQTGLSDLFERERPIPPEALSVHLWAHLWWNRDRRDYSAVHAGWCTPSVLRWARTTFADMARPYLGSEGPATDRPGRRGIERTPRDDTDAWRYLSFDETSGYGVAADRCRAALEGSGLEIGWTPFVRGARWGLGYQPATQLEPSGSPHIASGATAAGQDPRPDPWPEPPDAGPGTVVVAHLVPEYFPLVRQRNPDAFLVGHTVWETDRLPHHWVPSLNLADLLVVPSRFSAEVIATSPVVAPVAVVPHVATTVPARPVEGWGASSETFVFYTIADWNQRKAPFKTIEAYLRAFTSRDPVLLIVKTSYRDFCAQPPTGRREVEPGTTAWSLAQLLARHRDPPAIRLVTRPLTDGEIATMHRGGDCFVSLCRSEGWGLGAFDAAAHGNPVVITGFGGQLDYLADSPYLVNFDLVPVEDPAGFPSYAPDQRWAEPDVDHGAALLCTVVQHRQQAAALAGSLAPEIRHRYRPEAIAAAFRSAVEEHRGAQGDHRGPARALGRQP